MADARSLGIEPVENRQEKVIDQDIFKIFALHMGLVTSDRLSGINSNQIEFDGVYKAALANNEAALAEYQQRGLINVFSADQLPLTASGKLAAEGRFEAVKRLSFLVADTRLTVVGAASGGQIAYIDENKNQWVADDNVKRMMLIAAAYNKQKGVMELISKYHKIYYHDVVMASGLGGHFDYVEEIITKLCNEGDAITGLTRCTFDRLRASLQTKEDGVRFLAQFEDDKFRADMAWRLDAEHLTAGDKPMLPYKAASLVTAASQIRRLIDIKGLPYDEASAQVESSPYYTMASLAAHSLFASAGAYVGSAIEAAAELDQGRDDDFRGETQESCRIM